MKPHKTIVLYATLTLFFSLAAVPLMANESPIVEMRTLSPKTANKAAVAAFDECTKSGFHIAVAVVSREGNLLAFIRSPLAGTHTIEVSQRKAYTAATYQTPTSAMMDRSELQLSPGVLLLGGGLPINIGGHFYGAIAVSGAPAGHKAGDIDEKCAQIGIDTIKEDIEFFE